MSISTTATNLVLSSLAACTLTAATGDAVPLLPGLAVVVVLTVSVSLLSRANRRVETILRAELGPPPPRRLAVRRRHAERTRAAMATRHY